MLRTRNLPYGFLRVEGVEVCIEIGGEDHILTATVDLPPVVDHTTTVEWELTAARLDDGRDTWRLVDRVHRWLDDDRGLRERVEEKFILEALDVAQKEVA